MPQIVTCPQCAGKLRVPDNLLGKKVRCPGCRQTFQTAAPKSQPADEEPIEEIMEEPEEEPVRRRSASPREERISEQPRSGRRAADRDDEVDDDRPRRRRREEDEDEYDEDYDDEPRRVNPRGGWDKVRMGVNLVMIGLWCWLGSLGLGVLGACLGGMILGAGVASRSGRAGVASLGFGGIVIFLSAGLMYLGSFAEMVLRLVGYGMCMGVPPHGRGGLRPLAVTAFCLGTVSALFSISYTVVNGFSTNFMASLPVSGGIAVIILYVLTSLCAFASFVLWLIFLRNVCRAVRARHLEGSPIAVLIAFITWGVVVGLVLLGAFLVLGASLEFGSMRSAGAWVIIFMIVLGLLGLVFIGLQVWYIMVMQKIRDAVASYRRRL